MRGVGQVTPPEHTRTAKHLNAPTSLTQAPVVLRPGNPGTNGNGDGGDGGGGYARSLSYDSGGGAGEPVPPHHQQQNKSLSVSITRADSVVVFGTQNGSVLLRGLGPAADSPANEAPAEVFIGMTPVIFVQAGPCGTVFAVCGDGSAGVLSLEAATTKVSCAQPIAMPPAPHGGYAVVHIDVDGRFGSCFPRKSASNHDCEDGDDDATACISAMLTWPGDPAACEVAQSLVGSQEVTATGIVVPSPITTVSTSGALVAIGTASGSVYLYRWAPGGSTLCAGTLEPPRQASGEPVTLLRLKNGYAVVAWGKACELHFFEAEHHEDPFTCAWHHRSAATIALPRSATSLCLNLDAHGAPVVAVGDDLGAVALHTLARNEQDRSLTSHSSRVLVIGMGVPVSDISCNPNVVASVCSNGALSINLR